MKNTLSFTFDGSPFIVAVAMLLVHGRLINPTEKSQVESALESLLRTSVGRSAMELAAHSDSVEKCSRVVDKNDETDVSSGIGIATLRLLSENGGITEIGPVLASIVSERESKAIGRASDVGKLFIAGGDDDGDVSEDRNVDTKHDGGFSVLKVKPNGEIEGDTSNLPQHVLDLIKGLAKWQESDAKQEG